MVFAAEEGRKLPLDGEGRPVGRRQRLLGVTTRLPKIFITMQDSAGSDAGPDIFSDSCSVLARTPPGSGGRMSAYAAAGWSPVRATIFNIL
jgi:hypothetical protein